MRRVSRTLAAAAALVLIPSVAAADEPLREHTKVSMPLLFGVDAALVDPTSTGFVFGWRPEGVWSIRRERRLVRHASDLARRRRDARRLFRLAGRSALGWARRRLPPRGPERVARHRPVRRFSSTRLGLRRHSARLARRLAPVARPATDDRHRLRAARHHLRRERGVHRRHRPRPQPLASASFAIGLGSLRGLAASPFMPRIS